MWIGGGAQIYRLAWAHTDELDICEVDQAPEGDAFFPVIEAEEWEEISRRPARRIRVRPLPAQGSGPGLMRAHASVLHLDLDAFFAAVEQRDKPSLRGKPVIVGGLGQRGVVSTASYEARRFGVQSAMPMHEARRRCPQAAFLSGRFGAYRRASAIVMALLRELSPLVEPLSLDEAFVDLAVGERSLEPESVLAEVGDLRAAVTEATGGLTASVGVGSSKFIAKVASELAKPNGVRMVPPGTEVELIAPLPARAIPGVGPVTMEKLSRLGVTTVADLQRLSPRELTRELGRAQGEWIGALAFARDDRAIEPDREAKSISVENTFESDVTDREKLEAVIVRDAAALARRLSTAQLFARTITLKARYPDFTTPTRSRTLDGATDAADVIASIARSLLESVEISRGLRLLGVGVAGLTESAQEALFDPRLVEFVEAPGGRACRDPGQVVELVEPQEPVVEPVEPQEPVVEPVEAPLVQLVEPQEPVVEPVETPVVELARDPGTGAGCAANCPAGDPSSGDPASVELVETPGARKPVSPWLTARSVADYRPGSDVVHDIHGPGWVWGSGLGRVTVRFETAETAPGPVRTFAMDDPALRPVDS